LAVAYFGMILKNELNHIYLKNIISIAEKNKSNDLYGYKQEFIELVKKYKTYKDYLYKKNVYGGISEKDIDEVFKTKSKTIGYCFEKELSNNIDFEGRISIQFKIEKNGNVSNIFVSDKNFNHETNVDECLKRQISRYQFPKSEKDFTMVTYPIFFYKN